MLTEAQAHALRQLPVVGPNRVRLLRTLFGLTQQQVSAATRVPIATLYAWERGAYQTTVHLQLAQQLAEFYRCTVDDLFPRREAVA
jgi:transcriptional regulator with XRE-family HTH domain